MPAVNPLIALGIPAPAAPAGQAATASGGQSGSRLVQPVSPDQTTQVNAAGTSENVAMHVALMVATAMIGVYVLKQSGFKFVVAGKVG